MNLKKTTLAPLFFISCLQANEIDLLSLSLEDLMQVEIYTASQETEKAAESPSITSVITAQQLKDWGITNIHDVLSLLPGIVKSETYLGQTTQTFRGVTPGLFNNKSLYLVNGHPSYESLIGSTLIDYIPIEIIDRIEVVRSPASVLYGTNAISGVINIITKQSDKNSNEIALRGGSYNHQYGNVTHMSENLSVSASVQRDDGYNYDGTHDEWGNPVNMEYRNDVENLFVDSYGDDWRINLGYFNLKKGKYGVNPWVWQNGLFETYSAYADANKTFSFDTAKLNLWLRYDKSDKDIHAGEFPFPQDCSSYILNVAQCNATNPTNPINRDTFSTVVNTVERYSFETQLKDSITDKLNYIVGASIHTEKLDPLLFIYDADGTVNPNGAPIQNSQETTTTAIYAQLKYQPNEDLTYIAGLRGEKEDDSSYSGLVPRLGVTYQVVPNTYLKAMYSEAYRTPVFIEKYVFLTNVLFGNPDLERETIKTLEFAIDSQINSSNILQVAIYGLKLEDEILRVAATGNASQYINGDGKEIHGIEFEWKSIIDNRLELIVNGSHSKGKDKSLNEENAQFIATHTANLILTYSLSKKWKATLSTQYVGEKDYVITRLATPSTVERGAIASYTLTNFNIRYTNNQHEVQLIWNNIFDKEYTYPEPVRRHTPDVPGGADTTAYIQYNYSF